jgi:hypothetical protein
LVEVFNGKRFLHLSQLQNSKKGVTPLESGGPEVIENTGFPLPRE